MTRIQEFKEINKTAYKRGRDSPASNDCEVVR